MTLVRPPSVKSPAAAYETSLALALDLGYVFVWFAFLVVGGGGTWYYKSVSDDAP
jgi:hypothetical protein